MGVSDSRLPVGGKSHPFGKCIFIFAGGTKRTFQEFERLCEKLDDDSNGKIDESSQKRTSKDLINLHVTPDFYQKVAVSTVFMMLLPSFFLRVLKVHSFSNPRHSALSAIFSAIDAIFL